MCRLLLLLIATSGCASPKMDDPDASVPVDSQVDSAHGTIDSAMTVDLRLPFDSPDLTADLSLLDQSVLDLRTPPPDLYRPDLYGADLSDLPCGVKINEVQLEAGTQTYDEFVELYNSCPTELVLAGHKLIYHTGSVASSDYLIYDLNLLKMPANGFIVFAGTKFSGTKYDYKFITSTVHLSDTYGGVGIVDTINSVIVDSVGWGTVTNNKNVFVRGKPAAVPPVGRSIGRIPDGWDTFSSFDDFTTRSVSTPQEANVQ